MTKQAESNARAFTVGIMLGAIFGLAFGLFFGVAFSRGACVSTPDNVIAGEMREMAENSNRKE